MVSRHVSHGREVNFCRTHTAMVVIVFMATLKCDLVCLFFFTSTGKLSPTKPGQVSLGTRGAKVLGDMPRLDRFSSGFGVYLILRGAAQNTKIKGETVFVAFWFAPRKICTNLPKLVLSLSVLKLHLEPRIVFKKKKRKTCFLFTFTATPKIFSSSDGASSIEH